MHGLKNILKREPSRLKRVTFYLKTSMNLMKLIIFQIKVAQCKRYQIVEPLPFELRVCSTEKENTDRKPLENQIVENPNREN